MDLVYYAILRMKVRTDQSRQIAIGSKGGIYFAEEPDLIAPLFQITLRVSDVVVIDEMTIFEVFRKRRLCSECSHFDFLTRGVAKGESENG